MCRTLMAKMLKSLKCTSEQVENGVDAVNLVKQKLSYAAAAGGGGVGSYSMEKTEGEYVVVK